MFKYLRFLLFPFSILYGFIIQIRNKLYDWNLLKSHQFDLPVICVGNLVLGGAGKTPTVEYLVRLLDGYKIAILSRGYGRKTKGFLLADELATVETIGDEPLQYFQKFKQVTVAVCEDRVYGIKQLEADHDVILLDDAYQHRAVKAGFNLLLFDYASTRKFQLMLPAGNLREPWSNYDRAQAVLVTKTPLPLNRMDQIEVRKRIDTRIDQRISFASIKYGALTPVFNAPLIDLETEKPAVFLLTGIANPKPLIAYLEGLSSWLKHFKHPDHYNFTRQDINQLINAFNNHPAKQKIIITTEKDAKRLIGKNLKDLLLNLPLYYLPIEIAIAPKDKLTFDQNILTYVANHKRIS